MNFKIKVILTRIFDKSIKTDWKMKLMLCLSLLFAVVYFAFNLSVLLFRAFIVEFINSNSWPTMLYFYRENLLFFLSGNLLLYLLCSIVGLFLLYGIFLLWRGFKWGLLFYSIGKVFQIILPIVFLGHRMLAIGDIMICLLFLVFYYSYSFSHQIEKENRKYNQLKQSQNQE